MLLIDCCWLIILQMVFTYVWLLSHELFKLILVLNTLLYGHAEGEQLSFIYLQTFTYHFPVYCPLYHSHWSVCFFIYLSFYSMYQDTFYNDYIDALFKVWVFWGFFFLIAQVCCITNRFEVLFHRWVIQLLITQNCQHVVQIILLISDTHMAATACVWVLSVRASEVQKCQCYSQITKHIAAVKQSSLCTKCVLWKATSFGVFWKTGVTLTVRMHLSFNNEKTFVLTNLAFKSATLKFYKKKHRKREGCMTCQRGSSPGLNWYVFSGQIIQC